MESAYIRKHARKLAPFSRSTLKPVADSVVSMRKGPRYVGYAALADFIFLLLYGFVTAPLVQKILHSMAGFVQCITNANKEQSPLSFLFLIIVYVLAVYFLFVLFQGIAWWSSTRLAGTHPKKLKTYLLRFTTVNIPWYILFVMVHAISYFATLTALVAKQSPDLAQPFAAKVSFAIIMYFAFVSHALINHYKPGKALSKALQLGIQKWYLVIPMYFVVVIVFFLVNAVMAVLSYVLPHETLLPAIVYYTLVALLVFPFFCWARTYLLKATTNYLNQKKH